MYPGGRPWELEISNAVKKSDCIFVFINSLSINKSGYLHKEITMALDIAQKQPEGAIYIIPVLIDTLDIPNRLSHLQCIYANSGPDIAAIIYPKLQKSLLYRALELNFITDKEIKLITSPVKFTGIKTVMGQFEGSPLKDGIYLVRGRNPDGSIYYGEAHIVRENGKYVAKYQIGGKNIIYSGESYTIGGRYGGGSVILHHGGSDVVYEGLSPSGIYEGVWGEGGTEQLIPASPFLYRQA